MTFLKALLNPWRFEELLHQAFTLGIFGSAKRAQKRAGRQALSQIREQGKQQRENLQFGEDLARERGAFGMLGNQTNRALEDQMGSMFGTLTNNFDNDSIFNQAQGICLQPDCR